METPIQKAVAILGSQTALAKKLGVVPQAVQQWVASGKPSIKRCLAIEQATGGQVTRFDLRPDVFGEAPSKAA